MVCALCKYDKPLQRSHIIPERIYKPLYDRGGRGKAQKLDKVEGVFTRQRPIQKGLREELLCSSCEDLLNEDYEKEFNELWFKKRILPEAIESGESIIIDGINYQQFKLYHLSILFKASVSSLAEFRQVDLGPQHTERIRLMVLKGECGKDIEYPIMCHAITKENNLIQYGLITSPFKLRLHGFNCYGFCFGGCVWYYVVDGRAINLFSSFMLNSQGELSIMPISWENFLRL